MTYRYMFDREGAQKLDGRLQEGFFMMAVANSCLNPLIYGTYKTGCRKLCCLSLLTGQFRCWEPKRKSSSDSSLNLNVTNCSRLSVCGTDRRTSTADAQTNMNSGLRAPKPKIRFEKSPRQIATSTLAYSTVKTNL